MLLISLKQTNDGGFILTGYRFIGGSNFRMLMVKTTSAGTLSWSKDYGGTKGDFGYEAEQTPDGGYVFTGYGNSFGAGGNDIYLLKTNASGNLSWSKAFGGSSSEKGITVQTASDGGFLLAGYTTSFGNGPAGKADMYLIKTDASGSSGCNETSPSMTEGSNIVSQGSITFTESNGGTEGSGGTAGNPSTTGRDACTNLCLLKVTPSSAAICSGQSITLTALGASGYTWSPATGLNSTTGATVIANPTITTTYTVTGAGTVNCSPLTVTVNVASVPSNPCTNCSILICMSDANTYTVNAGQTLCVVPGGTVTGTIVLNGGTICNSGTFTPTSFTMNSGTFNNYSQFTYNNNVSLLSTSIFNNLSAGIVQITGTIKAASGAQFLESSGSKLLSTP